VSPARVAVALWAAPGSRSLLRGGCDCRPAYLFNGQPEAWSPACSGWPQPTAPIAAVARARRRLHFARCPLSCGSRVDISAWMAYSGGTLAFARRAWFLELAGGSAAFVPQVDGGYLATLYAGWMPADALGLRRCDQPPRTLRVYPSFAGRSAAEGNGAPQPSGGARRLLPGSPRRGVSGRRKVSPAPASSPPSAGPVLSPNYSCTGASPPRSSTSSTSAANPESRRARGLSACGGAHIYWFPQGGPRRYLACMAVWRRPRSP